MEEIREKVLIVEDEPDTRFILSKLLEKENYDVASVANGIEALKKLETFLPKVIIADWTMPQMDGLELCDRIKKKEKLKSIYYIILTARSAVKDRVKGLDVGADDFLLKPTENQELLARIRSGIRIYNLQTELKHSEHEKALLEMAATIGHNLNNPLGSLKLFVSDLESQLKENNLNNFSEDFSLINQSIDRISALVKDLAKLKDPKSETYISDTKMIKLN
ncbi:MAG: response regulator [Bacteroidetes bacterium]|nr:response regulator [Bacteroidota bacterium]MBU1115136.1 response regulator [Bacteroidota bacterium]MBU1799275.1 response regulator [Bacteroidota bacterium]